MKVQETTLHLLFAMLCQNARNFLSEMCKNLRIKPGISRIGSVLAEKQEKSKFL
jgi:hypothetical protein